MAEEASVVETVFTVTDRASGTLATVAKGADQAAKSSERAKKSVGGALPPPLAQKLSGETVKQGGVLPGLGRREPVGRAPTHARVDPEEAALFKAEREEMLVRRQRKRHIALEGSKETIAHGTAMALMMAMGAEQNKTIDRLAKFGAASQAVGTVLFQHGGKLGKVGGILESAGGYAAILAAGLEIAASAAETFGVDVDALGFAAKKWAVGLDAEGRRRSEAMDAVEKAGYFAAGKEREAAIEVASKMAGERKVAEAMRDFSKVVDVRAVTSTKTQEEMDASVLKLAAEFSAATGLGLEASVEKIRGGLEGSMVAVKERIEKEAQLASVASAAVEKERLMIPAAGATVEAQIQARNRIAEVADIWSRLGKIPVEKATEALTQAIERTTEDQERRLRESERARIISEDAARVAAKTIRMRVPGEHASVKAQTRYSDALMSAAKQVLPALPVEIRESPDALSGMMEKIKDAKVSMHMDFRGSRFDIKQQYAEGFDPDRIAVAFANDLATLGERRLQSGFSTLFGVR